MASDDTLGKRIRIVRTNRGISQQKLAGLIGVTTQTVNKYENEHAIPDATILARLAEAIYCEDPGWLLTGKRIQSVPGSEAICPVWYDRQTRKIMCSICDRLKVIYEADDVFGQTVIGIISMIEQLITLRSKISRR